MRISICIRRKTGTFRLVWVNESKTGVYLGNVGGTEESHVSYHQDGNRHFKVGDEYHGEFRDEPIVSFLGLKQLLHASMPITDQWFTESTKFAPDNKTHSVILVDEMRLIGFDTIAIDLFLLHRSAESEFVTELGKTVDGRAHFELNVATIVALDNFPEHKIGLALWAARTRSEVS